MIEAESLSKNYGPIAAIQGISFKAERGDVLGFLGPNGAGKTTTMRIITGFMPASGGRAVVAGYDVFEHPREIKKRIGYLPERPPLYRDMIARDYLDFVAELKGVGASNRKAAVNSAIESCGLSDVAERLAGHLSKGYQQRLGIAQAMVNDPEVLVLDEPTIGLDPKQIVEMREMIRALAGNRTVILSSHILAEVSQICNKVVIINRGRVIAADSIDSLRKTVESTDKVRLRVKNGDSSVADTIKALPGVKSVSSEKRGTWMIDAEPGSGAVESVAKAALSKGWGLEEASHVEMSLEDVFLKLIQESNAATEQGEPPAVEGGR